MSRDIYKELWTKPNGGRIEGGRLGWVGQGKVIVGKWIQLYLNYNKKTIDLNN